MVVAREDLGIGNARLMAGVLTMNQLAGPGRGNLARIVLPGSSCSWTASLTRRPPRRQFRPTGRHIDTLARPFMPDSSGYRLAHMYRSL
jgi:hypothetical protein